MELPFYLLVSLLNDWLGVKGTTALDRAMSDRQQNGYFAGDADAEVWGCVH
jgi:hypothetical protein